MILFTSSLPLKMTVKRSKRQVMEMKDIFALYSSLKYFIFMYVYFYVKPKVLRALFLLITSDVLSVGAFLNTVYTLCRLYTNKSLLQNAFMRRFTVIILLFGAQPVSVRTHWRSATSVLYCKMFSGLKSATRFQLCF